MKKKEKNGNEYAHNPGYCMIRPEADEEDDVVSTGQSRRHANFGQILNKKEKCHAKRRTCVHEI